MNQVQTTQERARALWAQRRVVVVGAGCSGIAAATLLLDCGAEVVLTDSRDATQIAEAADMIERGAEFVAGGHPEEIFRDADVAVFSPGIRPEAPVSLLAREAGVEVVAEIEVAASMIEAPIIAITGSNGKSTVTAMVGAIFSAAGLRAPVCGNIGTALSDAARSEILEGAPPSAYVVEISSFQAHGIRDFHPRLAAILNIQPDHIDWHGSFEAYAAAKLRLVANMGAADHIVYNRDDVELATSLSGSEAGLVPFTQGAGTEAPPAAWVSDGRIWWWPVGGEPVSLLDVQDLGVIGPHNQANACAAAALGALAGIDTQSIATGLSAYRPLEHRMEPCGAVAGIACINDSKATNIDATLAALAGFERGVWLILGGRDKGADFQELLPLLDARVAEILLIGEASEAIEASLGKHRALRPCETMERAVEYAVAFASAGDTLLLSPACTSFDQYPDFEARGRHFKALVAARAAGSDGAIDPDPEIP